MTYNRSEIMKDAWNRYRRLGFRKFAPWQFAYCLRMAWHDARFAITSLINLAERRAALQEEITRLEYSDALGATEKKAAARRQLTALPLAA